MSEERLIALQRALQTEQNHLAFITQELHWGDDVPKVRDCKARIITREAAVASAQSQSDQRE